MAEHELGLSFQALPPGRPPQETADLKTLIKRVLEPYTDRINVEPSPSLQLIRRQIQPLGMALHELATNAVEYGALSIPGGDVGLRWSVDREREQRVLSIVWSEANGSPVSQPDQEGIETDTIKHTIGDIQGNVDLAYNSDGLRACINIPVTTDDG